MPDRRNELELLAPARNADYGIAAIDHGADAVYIGGPLFGARASAGNSIADIARLAAHAHRFNARVLVALNTILRDEELDGAAQLVHEVYEAGADALIVQDMGLLELDLPPIELHASTQCDIRTPQKARFLEDVGFSQMVLARELSLSEIHQIAEQTTATLEFFIHGALCVSYSGQCYLSHARTGRSANRGDCSQACRLPYSLADAQGRTIAADRHLLSLKDNAQTDNLQALIEAGIRSFKIEGRLKDLSYVKNITAHYRQRIDAIMDSALDPSATLRRASAGRCTFFFTPAPEKTFNRGTTDYFVRQRSADIGAFDTPKFAGEPIGTVCMIARDSFELATHAELNNGDGLTFFDTNNELTGLRVNRAERITNGFRIHPALENGRCPAGLTPGTTLHRNLDQAFERQLARKSAERRIPVHMRLEETPDGLALQLTDERGVSATAKRACPKEAAHEPERAFTSLREGLGKLGATIYLAESIELALSTPLFIPASTLNALRRDAVEALDTARSAAWTRPQRRPAAVPPATYPDDTLSYLGNVYNRKARAFYERHGVKVIAPAFECRQERGEVSLMITKHCLRFSFNLCPKQVKGIRPDPLVLENGNDKLTLRFDCKRCEMHVVGRMKQKRTIPLHGPKR
jgi:putative protease